MNEEAAHSATQGRSSTSCFAEAANVQQHISESDVRVIAGDDVQGDQHKNVVRGQVTCDARFTGSTTLAEADNVEQQFTNSKVRVVAGDYVQGDQHVTVIQRQIVPHSGDTGNINRPEETTWTTRLIERISGRNERRFVQKVNAYSWRNVQGEVLEKFEDLTEPEKEFYPRMKTGFKLFKGDYVPQTGFSAHCNPQRGSYIFLEHFVNRIQERQQKPYVIIGQPGSGKTILLKRLAKNFLISSRLDASKKDSFWERLVSIFKNKSRTYHAVLHMNVRDMPYKDSTCLAELIFNPSVTSLTKDEMTYGLQAILNGRINIIMIFDGLDQASWEPRGNFKVGPWERTSTPMIFGNILMGHLLPHVPIVISSREHSIALLANELRPTFVAALVGFSESDARSMYCQIMGENSERDWDELRECNPGLHYMCLTPLFLIFYMLTKKHDPDDPPDCATEVMIRIIEIFVESENTRQINKSTNLKEIISNLKRMAFQGMIEQRVVFTKDDLNKFNVRYDEVSDIIIQVPGFSILGQKILDGMYRFFFGHQTLQEIFAALYVTEMSLKQFKSIVDIEYAKSYWSVVRSFTSGILNNERITRRISSFISERKEEQEKRDYLMWRLEMHLTSQLSTTERLDVFVALKEANALDSLRGHAANLDFSNSPLTLASLNILCFVLKHTGEVTHLSMANCGMDDELLKEFAKHTKGLGITIDTLDVRKNCDWSTVEPWSGIFRNMSITTCKIQIPFDEENETDSSLLIQIVDVAKQNGIVLLLDDIATISLNVEQISILNQGNVRFRIIQLRVKPASTTFDANYWREAFQQLSFSVDQCIVEPPVSKKKYVDARIWADAAMEAQVTGVGKISLHATDSINITMEGINILNRSGLSGKIKELCVKPASKLFDRIVWRQTFQNVQFTVDHCVVDAPAPNDEYVNAKIWIDAANDAHVAKVGKISLHSTESISMTTGEIKILNMSRLSGKIEKLTIKAETHLDDWKNTFQQLSVVIDLCIVEPPSPIKIKDFYIRPSAQFPLFATMSWHQEFVDMTFTVERCWIAPPRTSKSGVDVGKWLEEAREAARLFNKTEVLLSSHQELWLSMDDIRMLNETNFGGKIDVVKVADSKLLSAENWKEIIAITRKFAVMSTDYLTVPSLMDLGALQEGLGNLEIQRLTLFYGVGLRILNSESTAHIELTKHLELRLDNRLLSQHPEELGRFIADHNVEEVVFYPIYETIDMDSFARGLNGYQLDRMAALRITSGLVELIKICQVRTLYLSNHPDIQTMRKMMLSYNAKIISLDRNQWDQRYPAS